MKHDIEDYKFTAEAELKKVDDEAVKKKGDLDRRQGVVRQKLETGVARTTSVFWTNTLDFSLLRVMIGLTLPFGRTHLGRSSTCSQKRRSTVQAAASKCFSRKIANSYTVVCPCAHFVHSRLSVYAVFIACKLRGA